MSNELRKTNLFYYATSELSQDAFICYLVAHLIKECRNDNEQIYNCAVEFINKVLKTKGIEFNEDMEVEIKKQYNKIDVLIILSDKKHEKKYYVIIEDKTFTDTHNDQINRYKSGLIKSEKLDNDEDIICVFYKIIEQSEDEKDVDIEFKRNDILEILNKYKNNNNSQIFLDYIEYLEDIDTKVNSYKTLDISEWFSESYRGFFKDLKENFLKEEDSKWGFVNNVKGGFMFFCYSIFKKNDGHYIGIDKDFYDEIYLQIEDNELAVKYKITKDIAEYNRYKDNKGYIEKLKNNRDIIYKKVLENLNEKWKKSFNKTSFRKGRYMTVAKIEYDMSNYKEIFTDVKSALLSIKL